MLNAPLKVMWYAPIVINSAVAAEGGWYARRDGCTSAINAIAIALAQTRATFIAPLLIEADDAPTKTTTSHAQISAERCPTMTLCRRDVGWPGEHAMTITVGPSAAKSQG